MNQAVIATSTATPLTDVAVGPIHSTGRIERHPQGFGFFTSSDSVHLGVFVPPPLARLAWHKDTVDVTIGTDPRGRFIVETLQVNANSTLPPAMGRVVEGNGRTWVAPLDRRLPSILSCKNLKGANPGDLVVVQPIRPAERNPWTCSITQSFGLEWTPDTIEEAVTLAHQIERDFPADVLEAAKKMPATVTAAECVGRTDLRKVALVTIDGETTRDFDDAVWAGKRADGGFDLLVAVADVSHYVAVGDAIDLCAQRRATSVYWPRSCIPMLPEELSSGICSLQPGVDRLAMLCRMHVDAQGRVVSSEFEQAVMHSHARLTYQEVEDGWVHKDLSVRQAHGTQVDMAVTTLMDVYHVLTAARQARGVMEMGSPEVYWSWTDDGPIPKDGSDRLTSHRLVEECMVAANVAAAEALKSRGVAGPFRHHPAPGNVKRRDLAVALSDWGITTPDVVCRNFVSEVADACQTSEHGAFIQAAWQKAQESALYHDTNSSHFGLALDGYTHFTSPIRRYPDLEAHRSLKGLTVAATGPSFWEHCSQKERAAAASERDVSAYYACVYLSTQIGATRTAVVRGASPKALFVAPEGWGISVRIPDTMLTSVGWRHDPQGNRWLTQDGSPVPFGLTVTMQLASVSVDDTTVVGRLVPQLDANLLPRAF